VRRNGVLKFEKKSAFLSHAFKVRVLISDEFEKVNMRVVCGHGPCT
jgi:hypothetical protein